MKKSLILATIGLAAGVISSYGQGQITLDNYQSSGPQINMSAGLGGGLVPAGYTAGLYYGPANTDITGSIGADPSGTALPTDLNSQFVLATGAGATSAFIGQGFFSASAGYLIQASGTTFNNYTLMVVAYNGSDYASSTIRGHSAAFNVTAGDPKVGGSGSVGFNGLTGFSVYQVNAVPEPATLALAGLGGLGMLMAVRRKKA